MKHIRISLFAALLLALSLQAQLVRQQNTTLRFPAAITSGPGQYELKDAFPNLSFDRPVCIATPPGETDRIFVVERAGRIVVVKNLANPVKELFLDLTDRVNASDWVNNRRTEGLSSIAFHPNFASNHRFFVSYNTVINTSQGNGHHNRVSEFRASNDNRQGILSSEIALITQFDEGDGHNINDLHFGPDGYLYIATGDEGDAGTGDDYNNAQRIDKDFFSALMRIDVDKKATNPAPNSHPAANTSAYKIPADNPFVGVTSFNGIAVDPKKVRTEFYAVGLRNPWRFSFDPQTQKIYEGDVGQHFREEVNIITKGGNYGWSYREGASGNGPKAPPGGFSSILPIWEYGTGFGADQGFSVTGGVVYRGSTIGGLFGHLVFADYVSGNLWAMNIDQTPYQKPTRLLGQVGIAGFGYDPRNGDVLAVNHDLGKIQRLQYSSGSENLPTTLDQAGIFSNLSTLQVHPGIYNYDVNSPLWSDAALKNRWFSIPWGKRMQFNPNGSWAIPSGSVFIKHFEIETRSGDPSSKTRLETRVLVKTDQSVYGITYKWNSDGSNATLVGDAGDTRGLYITNGSATRRQTWRFPSRSECLSCHTDVGGRILGFNTPQMNRDFGYGSATANQIHALSNAGFFDNPPAQTHTLHALAPLNDTSVSRTYRIKSYLAANCSFCHQPGGTIYSQWDGRITTPLTSASIVNGPLSNSAGPDTKVIAPGNTNLSNMIVRMLSSGSDRMPPLASSVIDADAIKLLTEWVMEELPNAEWYDAWAVRTIGSGPQAGRDADPDADGVLNYAEYLMSSDPLRANNTGSFALPGAVTFRQPANRAIIIDTADSLPATGWSVYNHSQNKLIFPSTATDRTIPAPLSGPHQYFRLRVVEP